jgi:hypothetical protein
MLRLGPQFRQQGRVQRRTVGDHGFGLQAVALQVAKEAGHVFLVVGRHQCEGHGKAADRVGGEQQRERSEVQLVDTQDAAEALEHFAAMLGHVEFADGIVKAVVDETRGEIEAEVAFHASSDGFDVEVVFEDAVENRFADRVVVLGLGKHVVGMGAEGGAAIALGCGFTVGDAEDGDFLVGDGANIALEFSLAWCECAAGGARGLLGGTMNGYNTIGCFGIHACVLVVELW